MRTIATVLVILWLLGLVCRYTMGGFVHILLFIAIILVLATFFSGRKRGVRSRKQARSRQLSRDMGSQKTWILK
jgi:hypothetical protein